MTLINVGCFIGCIRRQIRQNIIREVPKAKCHQCSKQYKSENSIWGFANMVTWILNNKDKRATERITS